MAPTHKKRLLLLCGASLLALQLATPPFDLAHPGKGLRQAQAEESCFIAGTPILMADGSQRPIEQLGLGDLVVGRRGRINRVVRCERTLLGARRLYALNGGRPFVTAEHPFLTAEGWKALDPEATRRENARLLVASLQLGDQLCRGALPVGGGPFVQRTTTLELLSATGADPSTPLFNLLLDGDHSYVADGWIVHNKDGNADGGGGDGRTSDGATAAACPGTIPCRDAGTCSGPSRQLRDGCGTARLRVPSIRFARHRPAPGCRPATEERAAQPGPGARADPGPMAPARLNLVSRSGRGCR